MAAQEEAVGVEGWKVFLEEGASLTVSEEG